MGGSSLDLAGDGEGHRTGGAVGSGMGGGSSSGGMELWHWSIMEEEIGYGRLLWRVSPVVGISDGGWLRWWGSFGDDGATRWWPGQATVESYGPSWEKKEGFCVPFHGSICGPC